MYKFENKDEYIAHLEGKLAEMEWETKEPLYTIAVDFDRTLATYDPDNDIELGEPIPLMMERIRRWLAEGKVVVIFTKRANRSQEILRIQDWCEKYGLPRLSVTNVKLPEFKEIWDDIAISVERNTGKYKNANEKDNR